ncbi:MAG: hypothetical protein PHX34_03365 [Candidatus Shapirobacteria bacterium]|nr:hypothetical protein [Candidatus Shapirobacteria bacterium]
MELLRAIKKTIDYAKSFDCPINTKQINERLISKKIYKLEEVQKGLKNFVVNNKKNRWLTIKEKKAINLSKLIKNRFKDILFLGISGSVAAEYPNEKDDIDLMLITKKNKLWMTRFWLRWFIFKNKIPHRKYGQKENKNEFCFNLWLDEDGLVLPKKRQNLRSAVDLIMLKPLINKQKTYEKFILTNSWVKKYLATGYNKLINRSSMTDCKIKEKNKKNNFMDGIINKLFFWPQYWYMGGKITNEKVNYHRAFFHK